MVARKANLAFCLPGISGEDRQHMWGPCYDTPQQAIDETIARLGHDASIVAIPEGPYVFSQLEPELAAAI